MKILLLHCDYLRFKALKKALKKVEDLSEKEKQGEMKECLVVLTAVEKGDGKESVGEFIKNIKDVASQVKVKNIVLYPYAHLSKNLSNPEVAVGVLKEAEKQLRGFKILRAPFGYYKEFELKVKGHPLSELSREIHVSGKEDESFDAKQLLREISKAKLDTSKLKENDHRIIGKQMDLFSFNDVAPGMAFWHNKGLVLRLWKVSGHWDKYKENNFVTEYEKRQFLIKPMNCPGGMLIFKNSLKSYKELPLRVGEFGYVHRQELSGVLSGLFRVVQFIQDDAHVYCTEKQLEGEVNALIDLMGFFYDKFDLKYRIELSTRPNSIGLFNARKI